MYTYLLQHILGKRRKADANLLGRQPAALLPKNPEYGLGTLATLTVATLGTIVNTNLIVNKKKCFLLKCHLARKCNFSLNHENRY